MTNLIERSAEMIAEEINQIKSQTYGILMSAKNYAYHSCMEIGKRLEEAKAMVAHGEWGDWLVNNVDYSESKAENLMRMYREFGNEQIDLLTGKSEAEIFEGLSQSQLVELFALPKPMRAEFVEEHREALESGDMSIRDQRELIRKLKDMVAEKDETIDEKDASHAELVQKLKASEAERASLSDQLSEAKEDLQRAEKKTAGAKKAYEAASARNVALAQELEELKATPAPTVEQITVTVHEPSQEQIDEIRAAAIAESEEKHKNDIEKLSSDLDEREKHHEQVLKEAQEAADKKIRQLLQKTDPHGSRVAYCMESIGRAITDINAEIAKMESEAPGSGQKMKMRCESAMLSLINRSGWQI